MVQGNGVRVLCFVFRVSFFGFPVWCLVAGERERLCVCVREKEREGERGRERERVRKKERER